MSTQAALGQAALQNRDYPTAIKHLSSALHESSSPLWLIQRSTAYQRAGQYELALADADNAVLAAITRARRELIATAQFRRGVALHGLGRYGDSRMCFNWCHKRNEKEKGLTIWLAKVKQEYEKSGGEEAECNKLTVKETPDKVEEVKAEKEVEVNRKNEDVKKEIETPSVVPAPPAQTPTEKIRHEWYQSGPQVSITIFAKGVPKEQAEVIIEEGNLEVRFPVLTSETTYDFTVSPLFSKIDPAQSTFRITPHKIEITLHKSTPGLKWSALEGTETISSSTDSSSALSPIPPLPKPETSPAYPTSSRTGPKNWDTLATDALKAEKKGGKESTGDDDEGEEIDGFFKQIYKNADPDTRRAMIKSYQESNGTALSTNWEDVKKGPVETQPPDGLEAKKWEG